MSEKYRKNIEKIADMVNDNHQGKIQVSFSGEKAPDRKIGDRWFDSDGKEWEQMKGYKSSVSHVKRGLFDAYCKDCKAGLTKPWDKDCQKADGRCYYCQINFEAELKSKTGIRWFAYRRLKDLRNMDALHKDMEQFVFEKHEFSKNEKIFDKSVSNALANAEIDTTNVKLTNNTK